MPLQVGLVGLPNSGKTTLFNALTRAGAEVTAYASVSEKANVGVATIPDERLEQIASLVGSRKVTPAAIRVLDVPGTGGSLVAGLRESDALLAVADGFSADADPERDLEAIRLELLVADRDHVERRLEKVRKEAKSGDPARREEVDDARSAARSPRGGELARRLAGRPAARARAADDEAADPARQRPGTGSTASSSWSSRSCRRSEAAEFRDGPSALDQVVHHLKEALGLIVFFTAGDTETRSLDAPSGPDRARGRREHPHRHRPRLHPLRGDPLGRPAHRGVARGGGAARSAAARREELRRRGRRRAQRPLQRLSASDGRCRRAARAGAGRSRRLAASAANHSAASRTKATPSERSSLSSPTSPTPADTPPTEIAESPPAVAINQVEMRPAATAVATAAR